MDLYCFILLFLFVVLPCTLFYLISSQELFIRVSFNVIFVLFFPLSCSVRVYKLFFSLLPALNLTVKQLIAWVYVRRGLHWLAHLWDKSTMYITFCPRFGTSLTSNFFTQNFVYKLWCLSYDFGTNIFRIVSFWLLLWAFGCTTILGLSTHLFDRKIIIFRPFQTLFFLVSESLHFWSIHDDGKIPKTINSVTQIVI